MKNLRRTSLYLFALCVPVVLCLAGCKGAEEKAPAGYYEGPMKPKGGGGAGDKTGGGEKKEEKGGGA